MSSANLLGTTALRERGWTAGMVVKLLGEADALKPNPHYRSAAPMRLYSTERVEAVERTDAFRAARKRASQRSGGAQKAIETKRTKLMQQAQDMEVSVTQFTPDDVREQAIDDYNAWQIERERFDEEPASRSSDAAFLERIAVNYIRHNLTRYDEHLEEVAGRVGVRGAVRLIRRKIYDAIAAAYPLLAGECERQFAFRNGE